MSIHVIRELLSLMHLVQHIRPSVPLVWVGCTKGWHHSCDMTTIIMQRHKIIVRW